MGENLNGVSWKKKCKQLINTQKDVYPLVIRKNTNQDHKEINILHSVNLKKVNVL